MKLVKWLCTALVLWLVGAEAWAQQRIALVVGISDYPDLQNLAGVGPDGQKLVGTLTELGFSGPSGPLRLTANLDRAEFNAKLNEFESAITRAGPDTIAFFYFAGHGLSVDLNGDDYILPRTSSAMLNSDLISVREISARLAALRTAGTVIVIDACRRLQNDSWASGFRSVRGEPPALRLDGPSRVYILQSTAPGKDALDGSGALGASFGAPFSTFLASELRRRGATIEDVFQAVAQSDAARAYGFGAPAWSISASGAADPLCLTSCPPAGPSRVVDCPLCPVMRLSPARGGVVGSPESERGRDKDEQLIQITRDEAVPLFVAETEVTIAEWMACERFGPCARVSDALRAWPKSAAMVNVTRADAETYAQWLSGLSGRAYRLPTEREWELAARAGTTTPFWFGGLPKPEDAAFDYATFCGEPLDAALARSLIHSSDRLNRTMPVRSFAPNPLGLYDTAGNAWEWTSSCEGQTCAREAKAILKGGSIWAAECDLRSANKLLRAPTKAGGDIGFRVVRDLTAEETLAAARTASQN